MTWMVARGASSIVAAVVLAGVAGADPTPKPVNMKPHSDKLVVLKDADGGVYVVMNERDDPHVFYGTGAGKVIYDQVLEGSRGRDGVAWSISVHAPRVEYPFMAQIGYRKDGTFYRACGNKLTSELTQLTGDKATEVIDKWKFLTTSVVRMPYLLARDDRGVYYYVDVLRPIYGGTGHRVFVGKKGALKQMTLTDVVTDSAGDVFSTKTGDLRLVRTFSEDKEQKTAQWIRGEKKRELIYLDIYMNQSLIYRELGLYKIPQTICSNI